MNQEELCRLDGLVRYRWDEPCLGEVKEVPLELYPGPEVIKLVFLRLEDTGGDRMLGEGAWVTQPVSLRFCFFFS